MVRWGISWTRALYLGYCMIISSASLGLHMDASCSVNYRLRVLDRNYTAPFHILTEVSRPLRFGGRPNQGVRGSAPRDTQLYHRWV